MLLALLLNASALFRAVVAAAVANVSAALCALLAAVVANVSAAVCALLAAVRSEERRVGSVRLLADVTSVLKASICIAPFLSSNCRWGSVLSNDTSPATGVRV